MRALRWVLPVIGMLLLANCSSDNGISFQSVNNVVNDLIGVATLDNGEPIMINDLPLLDSDETSEPVPVL